MNDYAYQSSLLRALARIIDRVGASLYRPEPRRPHEVKRAVIFRLDQIGDAFYCTPLLDYLAARYPGIRIDVVTTSLNALIYENNPAVGTVHVYDYPRLARGKRDGLGALLALIRKLRAGRYDLAIDPRGEPLVALLSLVAPTRVGLAHEEVLSFLYTNPVRYYPAAPAWHRFQAILASLQIDAPTWEPHLFLTDEEKERAAQIADRIGPFLGLHLGAGVPFKRWPIASFAAIAEKALQRGLKVVVFGSAGEKALAEELRRYKVPFEDMSGKLSIRDTYATLGHAAAFVGNDSALVHMAAPQGMPAVHLMGVASPRSAAALGPQLHIVSGEDPQHECSPDTCPYPCPHMRALDPDDVAEALGWV